VRRWSDAGLLASHRVGRRGERRFARSDVLDLSSAGRKAPWGPSDTLLLEGSPIPIHTHLSSVYTSDGGRLRLGLPFLRDGIVAGQACVLMASPETVRKFEAELESEGISFERALEAGRLQVFGTFESADQGIEAFERAFLTITRRGGRLIRLLGEAVENGESLGSIDHLLQFEHRLDALIRRYPVVTLCQYDARRLKGDELVAVLKAHADNFDRSFAMFLN
jgi:hypothetical protein